jgi:isocitrate dehydrogenase
MKKNIDIAIAHGDGIGPEIMQATLQILQEASLPLSFHEIEVGQKCYLQGWKNGINPSAWDTLRSCKAFLKAPITTPQGGGFRSLNVTIRAVLGLYANIRPCAAYWPSVDTKYPKMNLVIVRENEEDLYTGIEYRTTQDSCQALKISTRKGAERIIRYAFEYAACNNRKHVSCFTKDNILKITDGLFHKTFDEIAKEYPAITQEHWIIDIGAAKMADTPEVFDVIVTSNLYGDIISDIAAQIAGSVGMAGSANIGEHFSMFEAIHGSAPRRAGQDLANPSGLILSAVMMLVHLEEYEGASLIHNAWLKTIEEGIHTYDIFQEKISKKKVGTREFAKNVIQRLGKAPITLLAPKYVKNRTASCAKTLPLSYDKSLYGVDIYIDNHQLQNFEAIANLVKAIKTPLILESISCRGTTVWPQKCPERSLSDNPRLRFISPQGHSLQAAEILFLQTALINKKLDITGHQALYFFEGERGFSSSSEE